MKLQTLSIVLFVLRLESILLNAKCCYTANTHTHRESHEEDDGEEERKWKRKKQRRKTPYALLGKFSINFVFRTFSLIASKRYALLFSFFLLVLFVQLLMLLMIPMPGVTTASSSSISNFMCILYDNNRSFFSRVCLFI